MLIMKSVSNRPKKHHRSRPDALLGQPSQMATKFYHNTNNNFHICHEVWIGLELYEFTSKAPVAGILNVQFFFHRQPMGVRPVAMGLW